MRLIVKTNLILLVLAVFLFACDQLFDGYSLMGTRVREKDLKGKCLKDVLIGQPVIPDRIIFDTMTGHFLLTYEADCVLGHRYPYVFLCCGGERVVGACVRK